MDLSIVREEKNEIEVEFDSVTIPELLRVYLNKDSNVEFAAWKQEHPTKKPILKVKTSGKSAKKAISDAVSLVVKELDSFEKEVKKI